MKTMKEIKLAIFALFLILAASFSARAQVERVVVEADGISKSCSPGLEAALKSMDSVYKYAISVPKQMFSVTYYKGEKFDPKQLHWAADKGETEILKFHVSAVGKVKQEGDKQILMAGEDKFLIVDSSKPIPNDVPIGFIGVVDDSKIPMEMKPDDFKLLTEEDLANSQPTSSDASGKDKDQEPAKVDATSKTGE